MSRFITKQESTTTVSVAKQVADLPQGSIIRILRGIVAEVAPAVIVKLDEGRYRSTLSAPANRINAGTTFTDDQLASFLSASAYRGWPVDHLAEDGAKRLAEITFVNPDATVSATDQILDLPAESLVKIVVKDITHSGGITYYLHRTGATGWKTTRDFPGMATKGGYLNKENVREAVTKLEDRGATFEVIEEGR